MKIAFYAYYKSFDFFRVGGTDSFLRRLTFALNKINGKIKIEYILYGDKKEIVAVNKHLKLVYIKHFDSSLEYIQKEKFDHIITTWLLLRDRKKFHQFSSVLNSYTKFHNILFFYPDTYLKKLRKLYELIFFKNNGRNFIVSNRQKKLFKYVANNLSIIHPPIDDKYFTQLSKSEEKIKITFLGRIDPRKGADKVINIFQKIENTNLFEMSIYGIYIKEDKEAVKLHDILKNQNKIKYIEVEREQFSEKVDDMVVNVLSQTDIFIQPYKNLDSTVDTPLLILEAMACNCAIITTSIEPVVDIYGKSEFLLNYDDFEKEALKLLSSLDRKTLEKEQQRIARKKDVLCELYESRNVATRFLDELNK